MMAGEYYPLEIQVSRGNFIESRHQASAVVVDESGDIVESFGSRDLLVSPRSAIKMLQAISFVESGAVEKYSLKQKHIAFACSSHVGEADHIKLANEWRQHLGLDLENFVCGAHLPYDESSAHALIRQGSKPTSAHNNCSGKHLGIMSSCLALGIDVKHYGDYDHPIQKRLRDLMTELSGVDHEKAPWGIDGCGIPTHAIPLKNIAVAMSHMIREGKYSKSVQKIIAAQRAEPFYIAGSKEFSTLLINATQGRVITKVGAEGVYTGFIPEVGRAFAFKCHDGGSRAAEISLCHWLESRNLVNEAEVETMRKFFRAEVKNWRGLVVGKIQAHSL